MTAKFCKDNRCCFKLKTGLIDDGKNGLNFIWEQRNGLYIFVNRSSTYICETLF